MRCRGYLLATMSSLAIGAASVVAPATAADLPARMPVKAPVIAPAPFSWTGFYVGIHGGGAWLKHRQTTFENNGACGSNNITIPSDCTLERPLVALPATIFNRDGSFTAWRLTEVGST
jgi:hypothetical protein